MGRKKIAIERIHDSRLRIVSNSLNYWKLANFCDNSKNKNILFNGKVYNSKNEESVIDQFLYFNFSRHFLYVSCLT